MIDPKENEVQASKGWEAAEVQVAQIIKIANFREIRNYKKT